MYLGIDIGGTKTLVAALTNEGLISESVKFPTPKTYPAFLRDLCAAIYGLNHKEFIACGVAAPGRINREKGTVEAFGNLPWRNVPLVGDIKKFMKLPVVLDNDANLAGLSEAMLIKQYKHVLYITVSTGIGTGIISNHQIDPDFQDSEGGEILLEHKGKLQKWENFASGRAIVGQFGKRASDINDERTWTIVSRNLAVGMFDLITFIQPDAIVMGGGVGTHLHKFKHLLEAELKKFETPITPIPPILQAQRPEEAVVYGCYDLAKSKYGPAN